MIPTNTRQKIGDESLPVRAPDVRLMICVASFGRIAACTSTVHGSLCLPVGSRKAEPEQTLRAIAWGNRNG